jgi:hypothetical protein
MHRKVAVGAWIPVLVVGLALFTGPNRSSSATSAAPTTTSPSPDNGSATPTTREPNVQRTQEEVIGAWVRAVPPRKTLPQQRGVQKFHAVRDRTILALHKATQRAHAELVHVNDRDILRNGYGN